MAGMGQNLSMQTGMRQTMALTPQMIQSMELLQMPLLDLEQRISEEVMLNPALELGEMTAENREAENAEYDNSPRETSGENEEYGTNLDCDWENVYERDNFTPSRSRSNDDEEERFDALAIAAGRKLSLDEYLLQQLGLLKLDERLLTMCGEIIAGLDRNGYFTSPLTEIGAGLVPPPDKQERGWALAAVQSLTPAGVAATSPAECLRLQLLARQNQDAGSDADTAAALRVVNEHLEDLAGNKLPKIAAALHLPLADVKNAVRLIQTLDPYPGRSYAARTEITVRPDVFIRLEKAGKNEYEKAVETAFRAKEKWRQASGALANNLIDERSARDYELAYLDAQTAVNLFDDDNMKWTVSAAGGVQPEISEMFLALYDNTGRGKALRESYERNPQKKAEFAELRAALRANGQNQEFREKYFNAGNIVRAVRQREITVTRLTREIVARQKDYLSGRSPVPAPLMMKDLAEKLNMDNGTVSRAASDKYADTPIGLRPLREFFTRAVATTEPVAENETAEEIGNIRIRNRIREMIEAEDKQHPLKDHIIKQMLAKEGIKIERRTVAKHRGILGYPSYLQRREY